MSGMEWTNEMSMLANAHDFLMAEHGALNAVDGAELIKAIMAKAWAEGFNAHEDAVRDIPNPYY